MNHKCYSTARHTVEIRQCCDRRMESKSTLSADSLLYKTSFAVRLKFRQSYDCSNTSEPPAMANVSETH